MNRMLLTFLALAACFTACERHSASELPGEHGTLAPDVPAKLPNAETAAPATPTPATGDAPAPAKAPNYFPDAK